MSDYIYPPIDKELELMLQMQAQDPEYILGGGYSPQIEALFLGNVRPAATETTDFDGSETKWERLEREANTLFQTLTQAGADLGSRDNAEKMAYFRVATSLMDKIVGIQERILNVKRLGTFQRTVISVMEDLMDGDQRAEARRRLEEAARGE